jgi:type IV pilus assembly protein PilQ
MTRTLCTILLITISSFFIQGCSLFSTGDGIEKVDEMDSTSVDGSLDASDEILSETQDLGKSENVDSVDNFDDAGDADEFAQNDNVDVDNDMALEDEFDSSEMNSFDDTNDSLSATNDQQVDQNLAKDEFSDFSDDDFNKKDEFAINEDPIIDDEPLPLSPVVDVPQDFVTATNEVTNLEYKAFENGGTVVIETVTPASYQTIENTELNQIIIQLNDVKLPQRFKRPYITKDFKQDIATINAYTDKETNSARFVIQLKRPIKPTVQKEGSSILVMTGGGSSILADSSEAQMNPYATDNNAVDDYAATGLQKNSSVDFSTNISASDPNQAFGNIDKSGIDLNSGKFTGDPINLEFTDTDVRTIIEVIANKSGVNLIMDEDVSGKASILLREVPWDQALLVTLRSKGLGYVKQGNVLRIAKQETLSKEAQAVSAQIKDEKEAKLLSSGLKVKYIPVSYAKVSELSTKLKEFTSKEGKIAFDDRTSSLVITDYGEYIERMEELVKALDTPPMQVEIEAKLVEAREEFTREAGINWGANGGSFTSGSKTGNLNVNSSGNLPATSALSMDLSIGTFDIFGDLTAALGLFEKQDKIKVLSQPKTVTMNKSEALIQQTTQIPVQVVIPTAGQVPIPSITYIDLTLSLQVTPQITFKGDVILEVDLKREFAGTQTNFGQREINKRHSKTTVMVKNGKTAVIGGIYQLDDTDVNSGIPWLKDIPLLGYLFKKTTESKSKNELLLFLKPKIIKEIDEQSEMIMAKPSKDFDPFEELTIDEGSDTKIPLENNSGDENFDESFEDSDFTDEVSL